MHSFPILHVLNGDSMRESLERSGISGRITVWADALYEGPAPYDADDSMFNEVRARHHAGPFLTYEQALAMGARWNEGLALYTIEDEVVLWLEHDLFDQLLLIRHLDWFARQTRQPLLTSLVCIGDFPGVDPFHGLGQLTPRQLASLFPARTPVTGEQRALGHRAWRAFTGPDPRALERLLATDTSALPFLDDALRRLLEEFPDSRTGLPRTERTLLEMLAASGGKLTFGKLFRAQQSTEQRVFLGDWTVWSRIEGLARGDRPLVKLGHMPSDRALSHVKVSITNDGNNVLLGENDWMRIAPFDRWIGGSHLVSPAVPYRWNATARGIQAE